MNGFWKWFLIVIGVLILIGLIATPFAMHSFSRLGGYPMMQRSIFQDGPSDRGDFDGNFSQRGDFNRFPMHRGFMMPFGGFMMIPFFGLFCLVSLGILGLAIFGIVALVNRPKAEKATPLAEVLEIHTEPCVKCGRPVQDDWTVCPHCGQKVRRPK
jgi:hypothetical protein